MAGIIPGLHKFLSFLPWLPDLDCLPPNRHLIFPDIACHIFILVLVFMGSVVVRGMSVKPRRFVSQLHLISYGTIGKLFLVRSSVMGLKIVPCIECCEKYINI